MTKFVYFDRRDYCYKEIEEKYIDTPNNLTSYFGYIEDQLDDNNQLIIYKLVPQKTLVKNVNFKFKEK